MSLVRRCLLPALVAAMICIAVASFVRGREGALSAAVGSVIVGLLFVSGPLALGPAGKPSPGRAALFFVLFLVGNSIALVAALAVLLNVGGMADYFDEMALGATIVIGSLTWTVAMVRALANSRQPLYDLDSDL